MTKLEALKMFGPDVVIKAKEDYDYDNCDGFGMGDLDFWSISENDRIDYLMNAYKELK